MFLQAQDCNSLRLSVSKTDPSCIGGGDGFIQITATGGSGNYTYYLNSEKKEASNNNLKEGSYFVTVTDGKGCRVEEKVMLKSTVSISAELKLVQNGESKDLVVENVGSQTPVRYVFTRYNEDFSKVTTESSSGRLNNVVNGNYLVDIYYKNGCFVSQSIMVQ